MAYIKNINFNRRLGLVPLGLLASLGVGLLGSSSAQAAAPTVTATFMDAQGTTSLRPGEEAGSAGSFYVPVKIDMQNTASLSVSVKAATAELVGNNSNDNRIESVPGGAEYTIGQMNNQWGYRWNFGDTIYDSPIDGSNPKNYKQMPTTSTLLDTVSIYGSRDTTITKYLTLGFGVGVTGETPADTYTNEVTVSVVATPLGMTIFDITYMQDMTADVCHNTKTPTSKTISTSANINVGPNGTTPYTDLIDTDGSKQSLDNASDYVPQTTLIDKRDGKTYTIRKLADGNCWMVSNLEFDFVPTADKGTGSTPSTAFATNGTDKVTGTQITLTNADTDLNSITTWTPEVAAQLYGGAGVVFKTQRNAGQGSGTEGAASATTATAWNQSGADGLRSFSSAAGYPNALYSTKTAVTPAFGVSNTGEPWQKFGNLYNWTAATLGSGTKVTADGKNATDSICPRGWKLPYNVGNDSFSNLLGTYGLPTTNTDNVAPKANQLANFPLNFLRTGHYYYSDGKVYRRATHGYWWSATRSSATHANRLYTSTADVYPQYSVYRGYGFAVRCVAR